MRRILGAQETRKPININLLTPDSRTRNIRRTFELPSVAQVGSSGTQEEASLRRKSEIFNSFFFLGPSQKKSTKFCKNIYLDSETPAIVAISRSQKVTGTFWNRPVGRSLLFSLPPFIRILLQPVAFQDRRAASYTLRLEIYWIFILFWNTGPQQETGAFRTPCRFQGGNFTLDSANNWSLRFVNGHKRYAGQIRRVNIEFFRLLSL